MRIIVTFLLLTVNFLYTYCQENQDTCLYRKAVFLHYTGTNDSLTIGSGFLLLKDSNYFLVTAAHNLSYTRYETISIYFEDSLIWRSMPIFAVAKDQLMSLRVSSSYDLAVIKLSISKEGRSIINRIAIPYDKISFDANIIRKGTAVLGVGYVDVIGSWPNLTPKRFIDSTTIDYGIIELNRFDNGALSKFFVLNGPVQRGLSGGPVFYNVNNKYDSYKLLGVMHGCFIDKSGPTYSLVTPLTDLSKLINSY